MFEICNGGYFIILVSTRLSVERMFFEFVNCLMCILCRIMKQGSFIRLFELIVVPKRAGCISFAESDKSRFEGWPILRKCHFYFFVRGQVSFFLIYVVVDIFAIGQLFLMRCVLHHRYGLAHSVHRKICLLNGQIVRGRASAYFCALHSWTGEAMEEMLQVIRKSSTCAQTGVYNLQGNNNLFPVLLYACISFQDYNQSPLSMHQYINRRGGR